MALLFFRGGTAVGRKGRRWVVAALSAGWGSHTSLTVSANVWVYLLLIIPAAGVLGLRGWEQTGPT